MAIETLPDVPRNVLSRSFGDPQILDAMEAVFRNTVSGVPEAVGEAQQTADDALSTAGSAQTTADAAQTAVNGVAGAPIVTFAASTDLTNERVLTGGTGVTLDISVADLITIVVNVVTVLGYTPANKAGDTFTGAVDVQAALQCDSLRVDVAPTATATASTHSIPINCNGVVYYMRLSSAP